MFGSHLAGNPNVAMHSGETAGGLMNRLVITGNGRVRGIYKPVTVRLGKRADLRSQRGKGAVHHMLGRLEVRGVTAEVAHPLSDDRISHRIKLIPQKSKRRERERER